MKMKIVDIIKKSSTEDMAKLIGALGAMRALGLSAEEAFKLEYQETLKVLQSEIEIDYKQTNADRIRSMSDEELAAVIMCPNESGQADIECDKSDNCNCYECCLKWLPSETEE